MSQHAPGSVKVFRDPVHNLITIDAGDRRALLPLIDAPEVQRLRRIRQLGLSSLTFHGAEHSRFAHSIGTYHVAKRMLDSLHARRHEFEELFAPLHARRCEVLAAALLHDVGHAPFSHVLERTLIPTNPPTGYPKSHEEWTQRIIRDRIANSGLGDLDWNFVLSLYDRTASTCSPAHDIISSQLDADRLDYLLRDARAAGVPYAAQLDLDWLLNQIRVGGVQLPGVQDPVPRLCFTTPKARGVIEQYVLARQSMYLQVYMHKTTRAYEALLRHLFGLAAHIVADGGSLPDGTPEVVRKVVNREPLHTEEYLDLDDFVVWTVLRLWARAQAPKGSPMEVLARKSDMLVNRRRPYRTIELTSRELCDAAVGVEAVLRTRQSLARFSYHRDTFQDAPYRDIFYAAGKEEEEARVWPIYLLDHGGKTHLAEEDSLVIRQLAGVPMQVARVHYDEADKEVVCVLRKEGLI